jgi:ribose 5-phosphate isomerase B
VKFYIATDHAGIEYKDFIKDLLTNKGIDVEDLGPYNNDRVDYPDYAKKCANAVVNDSGSFGILICGTGIGMSIAANKVKGIRAALCHDAYTAAMARAHNDAQILCFGQRVLGLGTVESVIESFLEAKPEGGRHEQRVNKIMSIES